MLSKRGFSCLWAKGKEDALAMFLKEHVAVVLISMGRKDKAAPQLIRSLLKKHPEVVAIALTSGAMAGEAVRAMEAGAIDYFSRPIRDWERFLGILQQSVSLWERTYARDELRAHMQNVQRHRSLEGFHPIKGNSPSVHAVMDTIRLLAPLKVSTLIYGESGVGKELVARAIHHESPHKKSPFVAVNCVAIQPELFESELFGHERGSFTGAYSKKEGLCSQARDGTLFLDEIGDLPLRLQPKLLRLLEQRTFRPVGSVKSQMFHARIICATHVDLEKAVEEGRFRKDLYFRISAQEVYVPPLRDRKEDIQLLAYSFIEKYNHLCARNVQSISAQALQRLEAYDWDRNNVRELEREIQRAVVRAQERTILEEDMLFQTKSPHRSQQTSEDWLAGSYSDAQKHNKRKFLRAFIDHKLKCAHGNKSEAARISGMLPSNFSRLIRQLEELETEEKAAKKPDP